MAIKSLHVRTSLQKIWQTRRSFFAARLNVKCDSYVSLKPDTNAFAVDAFT